MSKIGINPKEYMEEARKVMLPEMVKNIMERFPKTGEQEMSKEIIQELFRATTIAAIEDYTTFMLEKIVEDNNNKIYEDLVKRGLIKE